MTILGELLSFVDDRTQLRQRLFGDFADDIRKRADLRRAMIAKDANIPLSAVEGVTPLPTAPSIVVNNPPAKSNLWPIAAGVLLTLASGGAGAGLMSFMRPAAPIAAKAASAPFSREIKIKLFNEKGELIPTASPVEPTPEPTP